ncbi:MAG: 1-acyl-sn-glycerol-3-phosphate acyltransferase [Myxococcota bacterium]|nr:1-acyl-sn-glycerol-3-phosphate acyltransferase [Myxococcota bacterium]
MLDIPRLDHIPLSPTPLSQKIIGWLGLGPNYTFAPVKIEVVDFDHVPSGSVIYAMNHTDRYNYWPFQYRIWRDYDRYTATWVKGKYYENWLLGKFMQYTNNLPTVSRGYLITRDFLSAMNRPPSDEEYTNLRRWVDAVSRGESPAVPVFDAELEKSLLGAARNVLGYAFDPARESYADYINEIFRIMMEKFVGLNRRCLELGLDVLIFPQGTRSVRLLPGHIGLAELAMSFKATVVPVGCSGSDHVYPGGSPFGKKGHIVYRMGQPISHEEMERFHLPEDFVPFDPQHEATHRANLQGYVDVVMDRINELVDPQYQFGEGGGAVETGSRRFLTG